MLLMEEVADAVLYFFFPWDELQEIKLSLPWLGISVLES